MMFKIDFEISWHHIITQLILKPIVQARATKVFILIIFFIFYFQTGVKNDKSEFFVSYKTVKNQYRWINEYLYNTIYIESLKNKCHPFLVVSLINAESEGYKYAVSSAGAQGYMQLMPVHTKGKDSFDTITNIIIGTDYLRQCIHKSKYRYGRDVYDSLRMYNQGLNGKRKKYKNWKYVRKIMRHYEVMIASNSGLI